MQLVCLSLLLLLPFNLAQGFSSSFMSFTGLKYPLSNRYVGSTRYPQYGGGYYPNNGIPPQGCPVCDSSVFGYCSHRLVHDSCCCGDPYYTENSFECQYTDCSYLHANSCRESNLISSCCCEDPYSSRNLFRIYGKK